MNLDKMDWKAWVALLLSVAILCGIGTNLMANAESATPSDMEIVSDEEGYWLDEAEGEVILDDPAYFMNIEEDEPPMAEGDVTTPTDEEADQPKDDGTQTETPTEQPEVPDDTQQTDPPTGQPDGTPENHPTEEPITDPEATPGVPTETPTEAPTEAPSEIPTETPTDSPTEQPPVDLKTLFDVDIKVPTEWRNFYSATVRIKITPAGEQMWHKVRYRIGTEEWVTIKNNDLVLYDGYYYTDIEVFYNAKMTVRLFCDEETYFDSNKEICIFDHYAPEVTAGFRDQVLHVEAMDDLAQVAGIQVNGLLFTTLVDGRLDVRMEEPLLGYRQLAIRAYDYAGNFSEPVTLDNPYYVEPTPEPTVTPKPTTKPTKKPTTTKKPSSGSISTKKPIAMPTATITTAPQQVVYVTPNPNQYTTYLPQATMEPETVYVPLGPGQPYKNEGNMQTLDLLYSASTNKQFITVQTKAGETYYMVIDYDKPIDEENEIYETYFLNLVDDRDLMSVVSEDEIVATPTPQIVYVTPEPTEVPQQTSPIVTQDKDNENSASTLLLIVGIAAIGGAIFWFVRQKKNGSSRNIPDLDEEFEFEDEDDSES